MDADILPIESGGKLTQEDLIRRAIIMELMCQFRLSKYAIEEKYHLHFDGDFDDYFAIEHSGLEALAADGLLHLRLV